MPSVAPTVRPAVAAAMPRPQPGRLALLDGVRGWCALSVVFFHVYWETFSAAVPAFRNPATGFFFDGHLAVCVFFVLSGEALSTAFFAGKGDAATVRLAIKRYPRLETPILAACLAMFARSCRKVSAPPSAGSARASSCQALASAAPGCWR